MKNSTKILFWFLLLIFSTILLKAENNDTIKISINQAEEIFFKKNLLLLAARFNVDASKAATVQAKLWSNPNIAIEQNIYNQYTKRWLDVTSSGNTEVQIQQLILIAGKRNKQIQLSELNTKLTEYQLFDLLRSLRFALRSELYDLYFLTKSLNFYDESISSVKNTVAATEIVFEKRSILMSELLRIKSLLFTLQSERLDIVNQINRIQSDIHLMLGDSGQELQKFYLPSMNEQSLDNIKIDSLNLASIFKNAFDNRPDMKIAGVGVQMQEANLSLQKSLAVPDITLGGRWSRAGSYIPDYFAFSVAIDIPVLNRNQGNIQLAKKTLEQFKALKESTKQTIEKEINIAFGKVAETDKIFKAFDKKFVEEYSTLVNSMASNYENKNIGVIQYTDFFESYRTTMLQFNKLQSNLLDSIEELNFAAGSIIITP